MRRRPKTLFCTKAFILDNGKVQDFPSIIEMADSRTRNEKARRMCNNDDSSKVNHRWTS